MTLGIEGLGTQCQQTREWSPLRAADVTVYSGRFEGRTAIVTGTASGIGRDVARRLAAEGARVSMWDLNASALATAAMEVGAAHTQAVDIAVEDAVDAAMRRSIDDLGGRLDVLVASAGITGPNAAVKDYSASDWRKVFDVNVNGAFYSNRAAVRIMEKSGYGRIVNVASVAGKEGNPNASAYSASKAALIALTKSLGKEMAATDIRVNCITPAAIKTPLFDQMTAEHIEFMLSKIPIGRFGAIDEATSLVCWLASEECSFSTGAVFDLSGGRATY
jgi:2-dehydro-3-deoxy-L-rhamnonate dehydrogenase (NAD+)